MGTAVLSFGPKLGFINNQTVGAPYYDQLRIFLRGVDSLVQCNVYSTTVLTAPSSPHDGQAYLLWGTPTGLAWEGKDNQIAVWTAQATQTGTNTLVPGWDFYAPNTGWIVWADDLQEFLYYTGITWAPLIGNITLTMPSEFVVNGSPFDLASNGTIAITKAPENANTVYASPVSGSADVPTFRGLVAADLPVATSSLFGAVKPDNTTITVTAGVISATTPSYQLTGDVTAGPGTGSQATTLATVNSNVGSFINAHITVNAKGLITAASSGSVGSVTSVGLAVPTRQTVSGSPVTGSGTLTITDNTQAANLVFAGPTTGSAVPTFRAIAASDLPVATTSAFGAVKPDGTTITVSSGIISAAAGYSLGGALSGIHVSFGASAGSSPVLNVISGTDGNHYIGFTTGSSPVANGAILTVTFTASRANAAPIVFPALNYGWGIYTALTQVPYIYIWSGTGYTLSAGSTALAAATEYAFAISCP